MSKHPRKPTEKNPPSSHEFNIKNFQDFILSSEEWLIERILLYAKQHGFSKYTSTLMEAWRLSISGISKALLSVVASDLKDLELKPDEDYSKDTSAAFGVLEAKRHRERGVELSMFLGFMKYYKQSYKDLIDQEGTSKEWGNTCKLKIERFFDRMELGFCTEWCSLTETDKIMELQKENRDTTKEKNRYLNIFETIHAPVVLIDEENSVENYNQAWNELFEKSSIPGSIYYNKNLSPKKKAPWFIDEISPLIRNDISDYTLEKKLITKKGPKHFQIKIKKMLDVSDNYRGMVIILNDLTEVKKAEKDKLLKEKLEAVLEMSGAVCHEINQPLQIILGQTELMKMDAEKDNPILENLEMIARQIIKMGQITNKLTNITKYETKSYLQKTIIDIEKSSHDDNIG